MNTIYIVTSSFKLYQNKKKTNVSNEKKRMQRHLHLQIHYSAVVLLKKDCKHQSHGSTATVYCYGVFLFNYKEGRDLINSKTCHIFVPVPSLDIEQNIIFIGVKSI